MVDVARLFPSLGKIPCFTAVNDKTQKTTPIGGPVQEFLPFFFPGRNPFLQSSPNKNKNGQMSNKERKIF
jgi:hypothetical protein